MKLRLSNPSERRVCFKIKSNVPRQYCVQPSIDVVLPNNHVDVTGKHSSMYLSALVLNHISSHFLVLRFGLFSHLYSVSAVTRHFDFGHSRYIMSVAIIESIP